MIASWTLLICLASWILLNLVLGGIVVLWRSLWLRLVERTWNGLLPSAVPYAMGTGDDAILFVHGFNDVPFLWRRFVERFSASGMTCRAMRLPGAGDGSGVAKLKDLQDAVRTEIEALAVEHRRVYLIGHSLGAALSLDVIMSGGDAVRSIAGVALIAPLIEVSRARSPVFSPCFYYRLVRLFCPGLRYLPSIFKEVLIAEDDAGFAYRRDRFVHVSWYDSLFALVVRLRGAADVPFIVPAIAFTAGRDRVVDSRATEDWCGRHSIAVRNVESASHPIPLCGGWRDVVSEIRKWMQAEKEECHE